MMRVLLVDNYDSFTFNLAQALGMLGAEVTVLRADDLRLDAAVAARPDRIVISPGPGRPEVAGRSVDLVRSAPESGIPTLGVCLGLQCAAVAFGAAVVRAPEPRHGKTSAVRHDGRGVFAGIPDPTIATRYHSLMVDPATLPADLVMTPLDAPATGASPRRVPLGSRAWRPWRVPADPGQIRLESKNSVVRHHAAWIR